MLQLGLLLWLLAAPTAEVEQITDRMTAPCEAARQLAARGPCLRPEDCGAYRDWKRLFGSPRTAPLDPQLAVRSARPREDSQLSYLCLAAKRSVAQQRAPR